LAAPAPGRTLTSMSEPTAPVATGSRAALVVLVALVVLSPWPFGSTHPVTSWLIALVCLLTATGVAIVRVLRREGLEVPLPAVLAAGVFLLGLLQLIPIPPALHALLAPGSAAIWHPAVPEAADVLGRGARPISVWPGATLRASAFGFGVTALATVALPALRDRRRMRVATTVVVGSGLAVALYGLLARLFLGDKLYGLFDVPTIAPFGPFVSKNHFSGYVEMTALLALGLAAGLAGEARRTPGFLGWASSRGAPRVVLAFGAAVVLALSVLVSLSRGGAFGLSIGVAVFLALRFLQARREGAHQHGRLLVVASVLLVSLATIVILPPEARERLGSITARDRDSSMVFRTRVWRGSLRLSARSPLVGHGLGTFVDAFPPHKTGGGEMRVEHAENDYLELLTEAGLAGLLLAIGAALGFAVQIRKEPQGSIGRLRRGISLGAASGLAALAAHGLVDFNLRIPSDGLLFAGLAAICLAAGPSCQVSRLRAGSLAAVGMAVLALVASSPAPGRSQALPSVRRLHAGAESGVLRLQESMDEIERHLRRRPADAEGWVWLGWLRATRGRTREGAILATYGASLDPQRRALRATVDRLSF
jgi:O-antigen ligase